MGVTMSLVLAMSLTACGTSSDNKNDTTGASAAAQTEAAAQTADSGQRPARKQLRSVWAIHSLPSICSTLLRRTLPRWWKNDPEAQSILTYIPARHLELIQNLQKPAQREMWIYIFLPRASIRHVIHHLLL